MSSLPRFAPRDALIAALILAVFFLTVFFAHLRERVIPRLANRILAENAIAEISAGFKAYLDEYDSWPHGVARTPQDLEGRVLEELMGANPRKIAFVSSGGYAKGKGGLSDDGKYLDPWGNPYRYLVGETNITALTVDTGWPPPAKPRVTIYKPLAVWCQANQDYPQGKHPPPASW